VAQRSEPRRDGAAARRRAVQPPPTGAAAPASRRFRSDRAGCAPRARPCS
jgi:hypothetical protein